MYATTRPATRSPTPRPPTGPIETPLGGPPLRREAGQPGQQAQVSRSSWWAPAWPAARPRRRSAELGYHVESFCYQDSPRRAHSIAAQGGINAAKNYRNDGDSVLPPVLRHGQGRRLPRPRVERHRLAEVSVEIIDQCVAQGVPFAREYGGLLDNRSFGGAQVSRTFYARGQTGQQLLLGAYQALERQIAAGTRGDVRPPRDARADRRRRPGARHRRARHGHRRDRDAPRRRRRAGHRRLRQRLLPLHQRQGLQRHGDLARAPQGRAVRQPLLHPDPPDLHPGQRRPPVEADADVGVAAQRRPRLGAEGRAATTAPPGDIPEDERDYFLERQYPRFGNLVPRDIASRAAKDVCDEGRGVGPGGLGVYLDFADAIARLGRERRRGQVRQPVRDVRAHHRRGPVRGRRCGSTRPSTTRWAGCGSTTTCSRRSPACS